MKKKTADITAHLRDCRADENMQRMIVILISFVLGGLLVLTLLSVVENSYYGSADSLVHRLLD